MARAYACCVSDAPFPQEISFYLAVKEYGVRAITGRDVLSAREVRDGFIARYAESIMASYRARKASKSQSDWDAAHPPEALEITRAQKEYMRWQK